MKEKKPSPKSSPVSPSTNKTASPYTGDKPSADTIKKHTVPRRPPSPRESIYSPQTAKYNHGAPAKLWELLRRNPAFREQVQRMAIEAASSDFKDQKAETIARQLSQIDSDNFIAGYVLHWIFKPEVLDFGDIRDYFPDDLKSGKEYIQSVLPYLDPEEAEDIQKMGLSKFCTEFPFYLRRDIHVFQWAEDSELRDRKDDSPPILGPLWDEKKHDDYQGRLQFDKGSFNLNTPWPMTPELFQKQLQWLWAHYDINTTSPFTCDRKYFPASRSVDWLLDETASTPERYAQLNYFRHNYELIGVPINYLYSEKNLDELARQFKEHLKKQLKVKHGFFAERESHLKSTQKYPQLLGGQLDWEVFVSCYPRLELLPGQGCKYQQSSYNKALEQFIDPRKTDGKTGKEESHVEKCLNRMLALTNAVFPSFEFGTLMETNWNLFSPLPKS
jgi:hypothetical protein